MNYKKIYDDLILKAKSENRKKLKKINLNYIYYEKHHILPICLGGSSNKENTVFLTFKEHFIAHKLLTYIYNGNRKMACAYHKMAYSNNKNCHISSREYAYARELISKIPQSQESIEKRKNTRKGYKHSSETLLKISITSKGRIPWNKGKIGLYRHSKETCEKISKGNKGKIRSEETKIKLKKPKTEEHKKHLSESNKGQIPWSKGKKGIFKIIICEYCGKNVPENIYNRYHGKSCKYKLI
jgi:hypothetical protein